MQLPHDREKIRRGQFWKKKDIGLVVELTGSKNGFFSYRKLNGKSKGHSVAERDLYRFWERA